MPKHALPLFAALTLALNVSALATQRQAHALQLSNGDDSQCQDYRIGSYASGAEIATMLQQAASDARAFGCVNLIVEEER